jgi:hypothetical protein
VISCLARRLLNCLVTGDSVLGTRSCSRYTCTRFYSSFFTFFWHHSIKDKAEVQNFKTFVKLSVKSLYKIGFSRKPRYQWKRTVSFCVFSKNVTFHSAYSTKTHNSASSLNTLYTAESAQFYSTFSPMTISLTPRFPWKREVWLRFFAESAQNNPKTHSSKDNTIFNSVFSATTLSHASRFRRKGSDRELQISWRICRIFSKMLAVLRFVSISDWKMQKSLKTDDENLVHVYL